MKWKLSSREWCTTQYQNDDIKDAQRSLQKSICVSFLKAFAKISSRAPESSVQLTKQYWLHVVSRSWPLKLSMEVEAAREVSWHWAPTLYMRNFSRSTVCCLKWDPSIECYFPSIQRWVALSNSIWKMIFTLVILVGYPIELRLIILQEGEYWTI